ncbi:MAG: alpha/beta fold hydrolase [Spirochaetota bacterium]
MSAVHSVAASLELPVVLVGHSLGGAAALLATRECPEVRAVATIGAPADPSHVTQLLSCGLDEVKATGKGTVKIAGREFLIRRDFIDALEATNMQSVVGEMKRPVLFFHSPVDQTVGIENAASLFWVRRTSEEFRIA